MESELKNTIVELSLEISSLKKNKQELEKENQTLKEDKYMFANKASNQEALAKRYMEEIEKLKTKIRELEGEQKTNDEAVKTNADNEPEENNGKTPINTDLAYHMKRSKMCRMFGGSLDPAQRVPPPPSDKPCSGISAVSA